MTDETPKDLHKRRSNEFSCNANNANVHAYYDKKFDRFSDRAKSALKIIELGCDTVRDLLRVNESSNDDDRRS